jgi:hypothetical protein
MAMPRVLCRVRLLIHNDYSVISKYSTVVNSVSINKCAQFRHSIRHFRTNFPAGLVLNFSQKQDKEDHRHIASSSSDSDSTDSEDDGKSPKSHPPLRPPQLSPARRCWPEFSGKNSAFWSRPKNANSGRTFPLITEGSWRRLECPRILPCNPFCLS